MNQPRSTYRTDYISYGCNQNDLSSDSEIRDFCVPENVDDCLKYISQEFSALGLSSFYSTANSCPYAVNCDIVKFLNGSFELLERNRSHVNLREDLENSNRRLFSDLNTVSKKNAQLKESLEQSENHNRTLIEKERQLKEKNNQLLQALKGEKDEVKKLTSQMHQQKSAYQHEIRKCESDMNQMRSRLNQILADKNPGKKIAGITSSSLLQRDSKQRGKWQTGSVAKSSIEEMYNSVISSYEVRNSEMVKEIREYRQCLEDILCQIAENVDLLEGGGTRSVDLASFRAMWDDSDWEGAMKDIFSSLLTKLRENVQVKQKNLPNHQNEFAVSVQLCQNCPKDCDTELKQPSSANSCEETRPSPCSSSSNLEERLNQLEMEQNRLSEERMKLSSTASFIEKAKADLELQKLKLVKMALKREISTCESHACFEAVAVVTTLDGVASLPSQDELERCLRDPSGSQAVQTLKPLWLSDIAEPPQDSLSASETNLPIAQSRSTSTSLETRYLEDSSEDLPTWAASTQTEPFPAGTSGSDFLNDVTEDEPQVPLNSSQEQNLDLLRSAVEDIEQRRSGSSPH